MADILENESPDEDQKRKLTYLFRKDYVVLTADSRLNDIARDLVWHFNERGYQGKAMLVALDKPTAVKMYDLIQKYWPQYISELEMRIKKASEVEEQKMLERKLARVKETEICVVVSSEQNEVAKFRDLGLDITPHRKKMVSRDLEKEFKEEENPFRLAIVCAMWITGFDAPCVSTVYLDKPIRGHTLMQTIARANRVLDDEKENGLIVDYGNVYRQLEQAYSVYGEGGAGRAGVSGKEKGDGAGQKKSVQELEELAQELERTISETKAFLQELHFDLAELTSSGLKPMEKLGKIKKAIDCISLNEKTRVRFELFAREVFRKYKALFPDDLAKPFTKDFNAIEAIYVQLNQQTKDADVSSIILKLQQAVDKMVVVVKGSDARDEDGILTQNFEQSRPLCFHACRQIWRPSALFVYSLLGDLFIHVEPFSNTFNIFNSQSSDFGNKFDGCSFNQGIFSHFAYRT